VHFVQHFQLLEWKQKAQKRKHGQQNKKGAQQTVWHVQCKTVPKAPDMCIQIVDGRGAAALLLANANCEA